MSLESVFTDQRTVCYKSHFAVQQKSAQYCKATILQLKKNAIVMTPVIVLSVSLGANFLPKIIFSNPTEDTIMIEHRCFSKECLCAYFGMSFFKGIYVYRDLCMCIALCVIPWCVGDEKREKRKKLRQRKK